MLTDVDEPVEVVAVFKGPMVFPQAIKWNGKVYKVEKVNMRHEIMDGSTLMHIFSVSDKTNFFKLAFNTKNLHWRLEQVYSDG